MTNFAVNCAVGTALYDSLLINWEAQAPFSGLTFHIGATYTGGGAAATARNELDTTYSWTINDAGIAP